MKALITGIAGFVGPYLAKELLQNNIEVFGTYLDKSELDNFDDSLDISALFKCDLTEENEILNIFKKYSFDLVYHLAAQSSVHQSFKSHKLTYNVNLIGTVNLLETIKTKSKVQKLLFASSSEVYGKISQNQLPINEQAPVAPLSHYSISKASAEMACKYFFKSFQIPIVITRGFNHSGPKQTPQFVISDFAKQIVEIECGIKEPVVYVGDLSAERDFLDVRDVVKAYAVLCEQGLPGEIYNVCSNKSQSIRSILEQLIALSEKDIKIKTDPSKVRPTEIPKLVGDNSKLVNTTGWKQTISLSQTLNDVLDFWRSRINSKSGQI